VRGDAIRRVAPAKVNLYLHVTGRRPDGYHLLDSLIVFADVGDVLEVRPAAELTLDVSGPFGAKVPMGADNLVLRAARALAAEAGVAPGAEIRLEKNLPAAAGLGGGSADAAAILHALVELWRVEIGADALAGLALGLGADVPVCLEAKPAFVGGIGEELARPPALPVIHAVLVTPAAALETALVFAAFAGEFSAPARFDGEAASTTALIALLAERRNDLQAPALALVPAIAEALALLERQPGCLLARMSGSGATCFGLFAKAEAAARAEAALIAERPDWWVVTAAFGGGSGE
jgi:4-diphosphocytidyl-2-C-methyl-D-erythritol kinase